MTRPTRTLLRMTLFLAIIGGLVSPLVPGLLAAFDFNPVLNGLVLGVFAVGVVLNFRQVWLLAPEVQWLEAIHRQSPTSIERLRLLAPLANMLGDGLERVGIAPTTLRSVLDSIASRLDDQREVGRYFVGLLIFLGLLGTFWGLSHAVGSMGQVIRSLTLGDGDAGAAFDKLKTGMEAPLGGMGMAFSTSLFGLAGSLVLGFLDLQAGQAQNTFFNELEEWLSGQTQLTADAPVAGTVADLAPPAYLHALLERTAERLDQVGISLEQAEHGRRQTLDLMDTIAQRLNVMSELVRADQALIARLGESQMQVQPLLSRLVDETVKGREQVVEQMRGEIRLLARSLSNIPAEGE